MYSYPVYNEPQSYMQNYNSSSNLGENYGGGDIVVYEVVHMVKNESGLNYLAQTNQG